MIRSCHQKLPTHGKIFKPSCGLVCVADALDVVACILRGYGDVSLGVFGLSFTQIMHCLGVRSASTVKRIIDRAIEAGLVRPIDVGKYGKRLAYRPTLRGVVHATIRDVFFGCPNLASLVIREAIKQLNGSCSSISDDMGACDCLKLKLLRLIDRVLSGDEVGLREAEFLITREVLNLFRRLREVLVSRYASSLIHSAGDPIKDSINEYRGLVERNCRNLLTLLHNWPD